MSPDSTTPSASPSTMTPPPGPVEVVRAIAIGKSLVVSYDAGEVAIRRMIRRLNGL